MALNSRFLIRLIATIKALTKDLQVTVLVSPYLSTDGYGKSVYGAATAYSVVLDLKSKVLSSSGGQEIVSHGSVLFMEGVNVSQKDRITLPDGSNPPIASVSSPVSADGQPLTTEVVFGQATASR